MPVAITGYRHGPGKGQTAMARFEYDPSIDDDGYTGDGGTSDDFNDEMPRDAAETLYSFLTGDDDQFDTSDPYDIEYDVP